MCSFFVLILADDIAQKPKNKEEKFSLGDTGGKKIFAFVFLLRKDSIIGDFALNNYI